MAAGLLLALQAAVHGVPGTAADPTASDPVSNLVAPVEVVLESARHPESHQICGLGGVLSFQVALSGRVWLRSGEVSLAAAFDAGKTAAVEGLRIGTGRHHLLISSEVLGNDLLGRRPWTLTFAPDTPGAPEAAASGAFQGAIANPPVLPVGHTFLAGVDLLDGHLVLQATDLELSGRHLGLEIARTYASQGYLSSSPLGGGWNVSFGQRLAVAASCGLYLVRTADGSTQAFHAAPDGRSLQPQRGYHTQLVRNPDSSFDFIDKASNHLHFAEPAVPGSGWPVLRAAWMSEAHGDRLVSRYDARGRLVQLDEWQPELGPVRSLLFTWTEVGGLERVAAVRARALGLRVEYAYDLAGRLLSAARYDDEQPPALERYEYAPARAGEPPLLTAHTPAGKPRTGYRYAAQDLETAARGQALGLGDPHFWVSLVEEASAAAQIFRYFVPPPGGAPLRTEAEVAGGDLTRYRLSMDGAPLEIDDPVPGGRRVTTFTWDPEHMVKVAESNTDGRVLRFAHDERGNLTEERDRTRTAAESVTRYAYDPRFNKLVLKIAPDGKRDTYDIDPRTGDLLRTDAAQGVISYTYDERGCLTSELSAKGRTQYAECDTYGQATLVIDPGGRRRSVLYDVRGRRRPD